MAARLFFGRTPARLFLGLCALLLTLAGETQACAICFSGMVITPGQKLDSADQAVLAVPLADEGRFRIVEVVKGDVLTDEIITEPGLSAQIAEPVRSSDGLTAGQKLPIVPSGKPLLLVRNKLAERWTSVGAIDAAYAGWLRRLAATNHGSDARPVRAWPQTTLNWSYLTDEEWRERVLLAAPYLESPEPLAAEIAYCDLARAPYSAQRILKPQLDAGKIAGWIEDPKLIYRRSGYTILLGVAGGPDDAERLEERIDAAWKRGDATNLAAMLAADLELRGPARVAWVEEKYFTDRKRTLPEINAALLALSVHGGADGVVPRDRVVQAYRFFIRERRPMASFVAVDLTDWQAWEATADYVEIIRTNAVKDPAGQFAIVNYLRQSPDAIAKAALETFANQSN